jgi:hypothetical protein
MEFKPVERAGTYLHSYLPTVCRSNVYAHATTAKKILKEQTRTRRVASRRLLPTATRLPVVALPITISQHCTFARPRDHNISLLLSIPWRKLRTMASRFIQFPGLLYTYCITLTNQGMSFQVVLPNGRKLELDSKEGADEFVDTYGTDFVSTSLTTTDEKELKLAYTLLLKVANNASPEKIASGIPGSEFRSLVEHTRDTLPTDRNWLRSDTVSISHGLLLPAIVSFSKHPSFFKIFLSNEGMEAVAKFSACRKTNDMTNNCVVEFIIKLVNNAFCALTQEGFSDEKALGTIEKTGLLGQFIRCVPVDPRHSANIVVGLQTCLQLVKKKLKAGTPTGDILDAVIAGKDGPINETVKSSLARLQSLALLSNSDWANVVKECNNCEKTETQMDGASLMKCKRCKLTYYCSKECQVADWKRHKQTCEEEGSEGKASRSNFKISQATACAFIKSNYFDIAKEVYKKTQTFNVTKKELLVEIDFFGDAPALRNEFKVWLTSGFLEGSSVADAPSWFRRLADKKNLERFLREEHEQTKSKDLLVVCRASNGLVSMSHNNVTADETGYPLFSDEVVESIGSEDYDRMVAYLGQQMTMRYLREKRSGST